MKCTEKKKDIQNPCHQTSVPHDRIRRCITKHVYQRTTRKTDAFRHVKKQLFPSMKRSPWWKRANFVNSVFRSPPPRAAKLTTIESQLQFDWSQLAERLHLSKQYEAFCKQNVLSLFIHLCCEVETDQLIFEKQIQSHLHGFKQCVAIVLISRGLTHCRQLFCCL